MNIHIRHPIEFEKIIGEQQLNSIDLTRKRMSVQQLLDSRENDDTLVLRLKDYIKSFERMTKRMDPTKKLQKQPTFQWIIDSKCVQSSCWKFEAVVPKTVLSQLYQLKAYEHLQKEDYVTASKSFEQASKCHVDATATLMAWKWKMPGTNHYVLQTDWHVSHMHRLQSLKTLCMLSVGLQKDSPVRALYTVAQRAAAEATKAIVKWPANDTTLQMCEAIRYYLSSHILWENEDYGASIHRLSTWLTNLDVDTLGFKAIEQELAKIPFLLRERQQVNNGAYFDIVQAGSPLPTPQELVMHTGANDLPHPKNTRNIQSEPAQGETRETLPESLPGPTL